MKNKLNALTPDASEEIFQLSREISESTLEAQKKKIQQDSPYSSAINDAIRDYDEFRSYHAIRLKEAVVTRPALIREIDFDLWVSCKKKTNRQLIEADLSPYAYDAEDGLIELHHIGQDAAAPFAELTVSEHQLYGNSKVLHDLTCTSWREDKKLEADYLAERRKYWQQRLKGQYTLVPIGEFKELEPCQFSPSEQIADKTRRAMELIFSECSIDDLSYIRGLAESYILIKQIGAKSINDYVNKKEQHSESTPTIRCSFCESQHYVSHGTYTTATETIQRYRCKNCEKTFTAVNNSIISGSNLSFIDWLKFIDCLYNGYSVAKTAKICNISEKSVQANRYKLFYALKQLDDAVQLAGDIVIDETYEPVSYKGNHADGILLPRSVHKRGKEIHKSGLSKEHVCIICALDSEGNSIARVCGLGNPSARKINAALSPAIKKDNVETLYADKSRVLACYAHQNGLPFKNAILPKKGTVRSKNAVYNAETAATIRQLQRINAYHSRLNRFLRNLQGVSSKYLSGYLYLFAWKERNKSRDLSEAYSELLSVMTQRNLHLTTEEITCGRFLPVPQQLEHQAHQTYFRDPKRAEKIYYLYAVEKVPVIKLAKIYGVSREAIYMVLRKCLYLNVPYLVREEPPVVLRGEEKRFAKTMEQYRINKEIYDQRIAWQGSVRDFEDAMMKKYNLSRQTIKNKVCIVKRVLALQEQFYIHECPTYLDLQTLYQSVYARFLELRQTKDYNAKTCISMVAEECHYSFRAVYFIVKTMKTSPETHFDRSRIRLSPLETLNRDKALFIDFLKWTGTRSSFSIWAAEKYNISSHEVSDIIKFCFLADPKRMQMV